MELELLEYWRSLGKLRWGILVMGIAAAASAAVFGISQPTLYEGRATVTVPISGVFSSPSAVRQVVANYTAHVRSVQVVEGVHEETDEALGALEKELRVRQSGDGNLVDIWYRSPSPDRAAVVPSLAAELALRAHLGPDVAEAEAFGELAVTALETVDEELENFADEAGGRLPSSEYEAGMTELTQLRAELGRARVAGETEDARAIEVLIGDAEAQLDGMSAPLRAERRLTEERDRANGLVAQAESELLQARGRQGVTDSGEVVHAGTVQLVPGLPSIVEAAATAMVVAALASLLALVTGEYARRAWSARREGGGPKGTASGRSGTRGSPNDHEGLGKELSELDSRPEFVGTSGAENAVDVWNEFGSAP